MLRLSWILSRLIIITETTHWQMEPIIFGAMKHRQQLKLKYGQNMQSSPCTPFRKPAFLVCPISGLFRPPFNYAGSRMFNK